MGKGGGDGELFLSAVDRLLEERLSIADRRCTGDLDAEDGDDDMVEIADDDPTLGVFKFGGSGGTGGASSGGPGVDELPVDKERGRRGGVVAVLLVAAPPDRRFQNFDFLSCSDDEDGRSSFTGDLPGDLSTPLVGLCGREGCIEVRRTRLAQR